MKTLKKTLCVVLAVVMAVGTLAISASATDFIDDADITYNEAVEMLTGLNVINGKDGNKFDPKGTLTRAEAAKIIVAILVGGDDNELTAISANASQVYSDVPATNWAAGYIEYLTNKGVVSGSNGKFMPEDELSSAAFTKMLLVALGYDADIEGMTGNSWIQNVNDLAKTAGIKDTTIGIGSASITRDEACQLAFLALTEGGMVKYQGGTSITVNGATITSGATLVALDDTGYEYYFDGHVETGYVASNGATVAGQKTTILNCGCIYNKATGVDLIGHVVDVYYKTKNATGTTYAIVDKTTEVAITATMTAAQVKTALNAAGVTTNQTTDVAKIANGVIDSDGFTTDITLGTTTGANITAGTILVYDKAVIGFVAPTAYVASNVTAINTTAGSESITLAVTGALANNSTTDVVNAYDGIAVGDIVIDVVCGNVHNLTKATTVDGTITKNANGTLTVGGVAYPASGATDNSGISDASPLNFTDTYTLYLDPNGAYFAITAKTTTVDTTLAYAVAKYSVSVAATNGTYGVAVAAHTDYFVQTIDMTGKEVIYLVASAAGSEPAAYTNVSAGALYNVSVASTEVSYTTGKATLDVATFTAVNTSVDAAKKAIATTTSTDMAANTAKLGNVYLTDAMTVIYVSGTLSDLKTTVTTGRQAIASDMVVYGTKADTTYTNYTAQYVIVKAAQSTTVSSTDVVYGTESAVSTATVPYTQANGTIGTAYEHTVYINGVKTTVKTATNTAIAGFKTYTVDSTTGLYTFSDYSTGVATDAMIKNVYGNLITTKTPTGGSLIANYTVDGLTDVDAGSAKIVDLVNTAADATPVTTLAGIMSGNYKVAYVTATANNVTTVTAIYVIGVVAAANT